MAFVLSNRRKLTCHKKNPQKYKKELNQTTDLHTVACSQGFLPNTNNLHTICIQLCSFKKWIMIIMIIIIIKIILTKKLCIQVTILNTNYLYTGV